MSFAHSHRPGRTAGPGPACPQPIESYLSQVRAALPGPARIHADIIPEVRSGLLDAADAHREAGLSPAAAALAAVAEFGPPAQLARAFRPGIAARQARRVAITLLATGPLVGLLWGAAARASHVGARAAPPWQWAGAPPAAPAGLTTMAAILLITIWTTLITLAATGRLTRWLPDQPRLAPTSAAIAGFGAATVDLILLALVAGQLATAPARLAAAPIALAAAASGTRLILARRAGQRCLASRASLP
ncbi:MAG TPA: permease prefix domain 1-containing protein [Streptosporangiaceae bacterium]